MPNPLTLKDTRAVDPVDTRYVQTKKQSQNVYDATFFYPVLQSEATGTYYKWADEAFLGGNQDTPTTVHGARAIDADFVQLNPTTMTTATYKTVEYGFEEGLDDTLVRKTQAPLSLTNAVNDRLLSEVLRGREARLQSVVQATASITTNNTTLSGTSQWSDYANSDPIDDIETGIEALRLSVVSDTSLYDLVAHTNDQTWRRLKWHPDLIGKMGSDKTQMVTDAEFAEFFGFVEIRVAQALHNNAAPGQASSITRRWTDDFAMFYRPRSGATETVALGYTFSSLDVNSKSWRMEPRTTQFLVSHDEDNKLVHEASEYLIKDTLA